MIQVVLQLPQFLYRWERLPGAEVVRDGQIRLGPYEVASRLSYFLWNTMPDQALVAAAAGELATDGGVPTQARRLLASPRARAALGAFFQQWVLQGDGIESPGKDPKRFPESTPALFRIMEAEIGSFGVAAVEGGPGGLRALLTAPVAFVDEKLARLYGIGGVGNKTPVSVAALESRPGLLTRAGFLARYATASSSHPPRRGAWVYERLLCGVMPPVPPDVPEPRPAADDLSTRERFAAHATNPCAQACHGLIDPIGFALEAYDAIGRLRATDGGKPVDATGRVRLPSGETRAVNGARELAAVLAEAPDVGACQSRQWLRFALGRDEEDRDAPALGALADGLSRTQGDLGDLSASMVVSFLVAETGRPFLYLADTAWELLHRLDRGRGRPPRGERGSVRRRRRTGAEDRDGAVPVLRAPEASQRGRPGISPGGRGRGLPVAPGRGRMGARARRARPARPARPPARGPV